MTMRPEWIRFSAEERVAKIQERLNARTPGQWHTGGFLYATGVARQNVWGPRQKPDDQSGLLVAQMALVADAEFIAHSPDDIAWLLKERAELRAELSECRSSLEAAEQNATWWEAECRDTLTAVTTLGVDDVHHVTRLSLSLREQSGRGSPPAVSPPTPDQHDLKRLREFQNAINDLAKLPGLPERGFAMAICRLNARYKLGHAFAPVVADAMSSVSAPREDATTTTENPAEIVRNGMRAMIPADAPLPFTSVDRARFERGRERRAVADVTLFDGRKGRVAVWRYSFGGVPAWAHEWLCLDGGGMSFDDGTWRRVEIPEPSSPPSVVFPSETIRSEDQ